MLGAVEGAMGAGGGCAPSQPPSSSLRRPPARITTTTTGQSARETCPQAIREAATRGGGFKSRRQAEPAPQTAAETVCAARKAQAPKAASCGAPGGLSASQAVRQQAAEGASVRERARLRLVVAPCRCVAWRVHQLRRRDGVGGEVEAPLCLHKRVRFIRCKHDERRRKERGCYRI